MEPVKDIQTNDKFTEEGAPAAVQVISGKLTNGAVAQVDEKRDFGDNLAFSEPEKQGSGRFRDKGTSWVLQWCDTILRRKLRAPSESIPSIEGTHPPNASVAQVSARPQAVTTRASFGPRLRPRERGSVQVRQRSPKVESTGVTNGVVHKTLAELYARYDRVLQEGQNPYHWHEDDEATVEDLGVSKDYKALDFDRFVKMKCAHCKLYFTHEQNVRDLDNGSSPCSYHPGKICTTWSTPRL